MPKSETAEESFGKPAPAIEVARWIKAYAAWFTEADASGHTEINDAFRAGYIHGCSDAMSEIERLRAALRPFARVSEIYPNAKSEADMLNLHDARCPVRMADFHRAAELCK